LEKGFLKALGREGNQAAGENEGGDEEDGG